MELCPLAVVVFGEIPGPCPALEPIADGGGVCGLMQRPMAYVPISTMLHGSKAMGNAAALLLGAGGGCDALEENEEPNKEFREMILARKYNRSEARRARKLWGID